MKPLVSIVIPAIPGRIDRLKMILSRLTLNASRHPSIPFETIIVDGSAHGEYKKLSLYFANISPTKYVHLPIGKFINAGYPRNVGFRLAEGSIFTQIDIDWFIGEDFLKGLIEPYIKGLQVINNGYMIDTNESVESRKVGVDYIRALNEVLLSQESGTDKEIMSIFENCKIPEPKLPQSIWLWAGPRKNFLSIGAYDEMYCRRWAYTREDDDLFFRMITSGLYRYGNSFSMFCGLHLWHPAVQRGQNNLNELNKKYYSEKIKTKEGEFSCNELVANIGRDWGKMTKDSHAVISGTTLGFKEVEKWVSTHQEDVRTYETPWENVDEVVNSLEKQ